MQEIILSTFTHILYDSSKIISFEMLLNRSVFYKKLRQTYNVILNKQ